MKAYFHATVAMENAEWLSADRYNVSLRKNYRANWFNDIDVDIMIPRVAKATNTILTVRIMITIITTYLINIKNDVRF